MESQLDNPLRAFCDVVNAVYVMHNSGVTHRDIKPENILLTDEQVCLTFVDTSSGLYVSLVDAW